MTLAAGAAGLTPALLTAPPSLAAAAPPQAIAAAAESGYTTRLADYAAALRYENIPADVRQRAKDCMCDTVATILFGGDLPWSKMIIAYAQRTGGGGQSRILGAGGVAVHAPAAALAHGAMTHAFELDNLTNPDSGAHPGATLFSSGLAVAQERGIGGRDLLTAFVAGAEVMIRIGHATKHSNETRGFHAPGTTGPFGAAVAVGHLMQFDAAKMTNALGVAGSLAGGLLEFARSGTGAMVKRLHLGRAAESGVLAASLAADGFTGPTTVLEGQAGFLRVFCNEWDMAALTEGLGEDYASRTIMMKRFACHITAHRPVEGILDLRAEHKFAPADVAAIEVIGNRRMATVNNIPAPSDVMVAQYSIPFSVALAVYRNPVDPRSFDEAVARDPEILALASRVRMTVTDGQDNRNLASTVKVTLKDGRVLERRVVDFRGTPERPLDRAGLLEKFLLLTQKFPRPEMERVFERLQNIEDEKSFAWLV
jgi:2-methylcitrate dehydratase PrpD